LRKGAGRAIQRGEGDLAMSKPPAMSKQPAPSKPPAMSKQPAPSKLGDLTEGQRAYEARRAAKAGMTLEKWLVDKDRRAKADAAEAAKEAEALAKTTQPEKKGWFGRLMDKAHKPIK
jgi:hypothetical protein